MRNSPTVQSLPFRGASTRALHRVSLSGAREGGLTNYERAAQAVELLLAIQTEGFPEAVSVPTFGWYEPWNQKPE